MTRIVRIVSVLFLLWSATVPAASVDLDAADQAAVRAAALDYAEGWYAGDRERMARSLHADLAKRAYLPGDDGARAFSHMGRDALLDGNRPANRERYANAPKRAEIEILDAFGNVATVRLAMDGWVDYLHVVRTPDDGWRIVNVLWELVPQGRTRER